MISEAAPETPFRSVIFREGDLLVTDARFVAGEQVYELGEIQGVRTVQSRPGAMAWLLLSMLCGFPICVTGIRRLLQGEWLLAALGAAITLLALAACLFRRPHFEIILTTAKGEFPAFVCEDRALASRLLEGLNYALGLNHARA